MRKYILFTLLIFPALLLTAQEKNDRNFRIPLIGEVAPSFTAESTNGVVNFPSDFGRSWKILFSHPQDFTPVCSSEILELANMQDEFDKKKTKLIVLSTDPVETHRDWKKALEAIEYKDRPFAKIKFPLVDDESLKVSKMYGMIHSASNTTRDVRGVFVIDPDNVIQAIYFYPTNVGRSTTELLRTVVALQTAQEHNVLTPADWQAGNDVFIPFRPNEDNKKAMEGMKNIYNVAWFMTYKKLTP